MANGEVEELEHPLLLGGGTMGLINLESSTLKVSLSWLPLVQLQETGRHKIVVFMFMEDCVVYYRQREREEEGEQERQTERSRERKGKEK